MQLLIKADGTLGTSAHIANTDGQPICKININPATWQIQERAPKGVFICRRCQRMQAQRDSAGN